MRYGSVCSGVEAATVAWHDLGWEPAFFSEIEAFPRAVLEHHYPDVPVHGDFTTIKEKEYGSIDLLVGGTPCQSFSIAGLRGGMDDERGNLALEFVRLAQRERPQWLVWENVPGVLSSNGGRDFGSLLGALAHIGYGFAYRVLDAQFFGVAQRRRRVFLVGYLGDWRPPAAVLFERESLSGNPAPSREAKKEAARGAGGCAEAGMSKGPRGTEAVESSHILPVLASGQANACLADNVSPTLNCNRDGAPIVGYVDSENNGLTPDKPMGTLLAGSPTGGGSPLPAVISDMQVRRLTPRECERLQGFPDDYTQIPYRNKAAEDCPKGPRYKAMGNSMAVPVMSWIGKRISKVSGILLEENAEASHG
jgi:DNA (cytosine-5)-methyltransferase 1